MARQKRREAEVLYMRLQKGRAISGSSFSSTGRGDNQRASSAPRADSDYLQSPTQLPVNPTTPVKGSRPQVPGLSLASLARQPAAAQAAQAAQAAPPKPAEAAAAAPSGIPRALRRAGERGGIKFGFQRAKPRRPGAEDTSSGADQRV